MTEITSRDNKKVKNVIKLVSDRKYRDREGLFVAEGPVALAEALKSGVPIAELYFTEKNTGIAQSADADEKYLVREKIMESMSDVKTPQGVLFVCRKIGGRELEKGPILVLENMRDSGNMGTVIRTAEGLGIKNIVLSGDCVDIYNPKTIRASMGSAFRVRPVRMTVEQVKSYTKEHGMSFYVTALSESSEDIRKKNLKNAAVLIGNEALGATPEALNAADGHIIIPIQTAQSFNASVAAAIVLWEMAR